MLLTNSCPNTPLGGAGKCLCEEVGRQDSRTESVIERMLVTWALSSQQQAPWPSAWSPRLLLGLGGGGAFQQLAGTSGQQRTPQGRESAGGSSRSGLQPLMGNQEPSLAPWQTAGCGGP